MVYRIVLESAQIFQHVPNIMSHLYLCIWIYYKNKLVIYAYIIPSDTNF